MSGLQLGSSEYVFPVAPPRICPDCEELLTKASDAMRRHAGQMGTAISMATVDTTEEQRHHWAKLLVESFNGAQSAWEKYREHLIEHGILPRR